MKLQKPIFRSRSSLLCGFYPLPRSACLLFGGHALLFLSAVGLLAALQNRDPTALLYGGALVDSLAISLVILWVTALWLCLPERTHPSDSPRPPSP